MATNNAVPYIGIDFGTSRSSMSWFNPKTGAAEIIKNREGKDETPSTVYFGADGVLVGSAAEDMLEDPQERRRVIRSVKRDLVNAPLLALPGRRVKPVEAAAEILRKLKHDAESNHFPEPVQRAVITHPAAFDALQLEKIREAATLAGFTEIVLLPEPVAAALAYAQAGLQVGDHVLVFDLGGGTFDLALLVREEQGGFRVALQPKGLARCGGDDFDRALYDHCDELAVEAHGRGITLTGDTDSIFLRQCRARKETLSAAERCTINAYLNGPDGNVQLSQEVDRGTFEALIAAPIEATVRLTQELVEEAKRAGYPVDTVVLIGGSSRVPLAQRRLRESLPVAPQQWQKQDVAVALGAALHAHLLWDAEPAMDAHQQTSNGGTRSATDTTAPNGTSAPGTGPVTSGSTSTTRPNKEHSFGSTPGVPPVNKRPSSTPVRPPRPIQPPVMDDGQQASFGRRLAAHAIDWTLVLLALDAAINLFTATGVAMFEQGSNGNTATPMGVLCFFAIPTLYFVSCTAIGGRTLGKLLVGLQVVRRNGGRMTLATALLRWLGEWLSAFFFVGYLWALWDARQETWADKIAGTRVIVRSRAQRTSVTPTAMPSSLV